MLILSFSHFHFQVQVQFLLLFSLILNVYLFSIIHWPCAISWVPFLYTYLSSAMYFFYISDSVWGVPISCPVMIILVQSYPPLWFFSQATFYYYQDTNSPSFFSVDHCMFPRQAVCSWILIYSILIVFFIPSFSIYQYITHFFLFYIWSNSYFCIILYISVHVLQYIRTF